MTSITVNTPQPAISRTHGLAIKQERGRITYDALINAGFRMLEESELQDISIADLTREAGYSVGAFYARFRSKDEFFDALMARHIEIRTVMQKQLFAAQPIDTLMPDMVSNLVGYYWHHRKFWRAVLVRSVRDPDFWEPIRQQGNALCARFISRVRNELGRDLNDVETGNIEFAFRVVLGTINSTILHQPGPIFMGQEPYVKELIRTFRLVASYDRLLSDG